MATSAGYDTSQQRGSESFFLHIKNLPKKYTWQDLKDLIRTQASHGIWTEMAVLTDDPTVGEGHARVQRKDEAYKLYRYLTENVIENRSLQVHLWNTSAVPAAFVRCNCPNAPLHPPSGMIAQKAVDPGWHTFSMSALPSMAQPGPYRTASMLLTPADLIQAPTQPQVTHDQIINAMAEMRLDPSNGQHVAFFKQQWQVGQTVQQEQRQQQQVAYLAQQQTAYLSRQQAQQQYPIYVASSSGTPINVGQGHIRVEARGVFVSGLNYKVRTRDIEEAFSRVGKIDKVELHQDTRSGKPKGNATIRYESAGAAQRAVEMFHGREVMNLRLNVRLDKDKVPVDTPPSVTAGASQSSTAAVAVRTTAEPIIVNGSQVRGPRPERYP